MIFPSCFVIIWKTASNVASSSLRSAPESAPSSNQGAGTVPRNGMGTAAWSWPYGGDSEGGETDASGNAKLGKIEDVIRGTLLRP